MRALAVAAVVLIACGLLAGIFLWDYGGQCLPSNALPPGSMSMRTDSNGEMVMEECRRQEIVLGSEIAAVLVAGVVLCVWLYRSPIYGVALERATAVVEHAKAVAEIATASDVAWRWWLGVVGLGILEIIAVAKTRIVAGSLGSFAEDFLISAASYCLFYFVLRSRFGDEPEHAPFWRYTPWSSASTLVFSMMIMAVVTAPAFLVRYNFSAPPQYYAELAGFVPWLAWSVLTGKLKFR